MRTNDLSTLMNLLKEDKRTWIVFKVYDRERWTGDYDVYETSPFGARANSNWVALVAIVSNGVVMAERKAVL